MIIKRKYINLEKLIDEDKEVKEIYEKAFESIENIDERKRIIEYNYQNRLEDITYGSGIPEKGVEFLEKEFDRLDEERPYELNEELKYSDTPFFMYGLRLWEAPESGINFKLCYKEKEQIILPYGEGFDSISMDDMEKIKDIILNEIWPLEEIGYDYTRNPKTLVMDGCENIICLNYNGIEKEITCWNLWNYLDDQGLSPSADKLISAINKLNDILNKYNFKLEIDYDEEDE